MGIYPDERWERGSLFERDGQVVRTVVNYHHVPGVTRIRVFECVAEIEIRDDCYCCSCGERDGSDVACRNHGWAARRPCEHHNMPGSPWDEEAGIELDGVMPDSVQAKRASYGPRGF